MEPEVLMSNAAATFASGLVKELVLPKITQFTEKIKHFYDVNMIPRGEHFEEYISRSYKKYSIINTLVLKNEQRLLRDLYIPLSIISDSQNESNSYKQKIESFPIQLINQFSRILVTDTAGMGKSTLSKFMFIDAIENGCGIPIFLELRRLSHEHSILDEIFSQINGLSRSFDDQLLLEFIQTGGFIFFLDGYDEVSLAERDFVTENIQEFVAKAHMNSFILTSRPENSLASFGDFKSFKIKPLDRDEAYNLIRKYDKNGEVSDRLVNELDSGQYKTIDEFLTNPLLVSLLYAAFDYKQIIPLKKSIFYRQVYDAYFDFHDLSKGDYFIHEKKSKLDTDEFGGVLRYIAFDCLKQHRIEFDKESILKVITDARDNCSKIEFSPSDFLSDMLSAVPLFCKDGQYFKWVHKSLQEYFAASFINNDAKDNQGAILDAIYNSENINQYINLLDIYYDIDNWGFREHIVLPLLESYITYYSKSVFHSDILSLDDIEERLGHIFLQEVCIMQCDRDKKKRQELFSYVSDRTLGVFKGELGVLSRRDNDDLMKVTTRSLKSDLLTLLYQRRPDLFRQYMRYDYPYYGMLGKDEIVYIEPNSAANNISLYLQLNGYCASVGRQLNAHLVFEECKKEVDNIRRHIKKREDKSAILVGL